MHKFASSLVVLLLLTSIASFAQSSEDLGRHAAERWIVLVDDQQYDQSWKEAAKLFQSSLSIEQWQKEAAERRSQIGSKNSRKLKDLKTTTSAKGLPAGQYVVVKYQSSFAKKKNATETVVAVVEPDGAWRVAAYSLE